MSTSRWIDRICVIVITLSLIMTVLFMNGEKLGIELVSDTDAEAYVGNEYFTANDLNGSWDTSEATVITLAGDTAKISGNGAYWLDGSLKIVQTGQYVISGELTDGNIVVDAKQYSKVWILLDGVTIFCSDDACIRVDQADKVFLTLAEGSKNILTGGETFSESALADGANAVIFSHDDLTINGAGSLEVVSSYENGITSKDDLIITGGTISVTAPSHGLRVNDHFRMTSADLTISAEKDGIHTEGAIVIQDGVLTITAGDDAVHSDTSVLILDGTILVNDCYEGIEALTIEISGGDTTIHAQDDALNANGYTGTGFGANMGQMPDMGENPFSAEGMSFPGNPPGMDGNRPEMAESNEAASESSEQSSENMPVPTEGAPDAESTDSAGIAGMKLFEADTEQTPGEAFERGNRGHRMSFGGGPESEGESRMDSTEEKTTVNVEDTWILISGGTLTILNESGRDADGLDSNGDVTITGGKIVISLVGSSGNSALDSGSESGGMMTISGGTVIACGDSSMAEGFESESAQASILYTLSETAAAGSIVTLLDAEGKELISETIPYAFSAVVLSCPEMSVGETYTIRIGESEQTVEMTSVSVSTGTGSDFGMFSGNGMPGAPDMGHGAHWDGETFPEPPEGMEGFGFPENREGFGGKPVDLQDADQAGETPADDASVSSETLSTSSENLKPQMPEAPDRDKGNFKEEGALDEGAEQTVATDNTASWSLVLGSVLCLLLGLIVALAYKRCQHIDA